MVVVLTSNFDGGIIQLAGQMKSTLQELYGDTVLFAPSNSKIKGIDYSGFDRVVSFSPFTKHYAKVAKEIEKLKPALVFVCDSDYVSARIASGLKKNILVVSCIHDVTSHSGYKSLKKGIKLWIKTPYIIKSWKKAEKIVLFSENSKKQFEKKHPELCKKIGIIKLGAHVPVQKETAPQEISAEKDYILFFGRFDKYKGIITLLKAYLERKAEIPAKVIIAGRGVLSDEELELIQKNTDKVILLKRYIEDGEMLWLFRNCSCVALPYTDATQSGVLSMAYYFKKPVFVSDVPGLTEFVENNSTGFIFSDTTELGEKLVNFFSSKPDMSSAVEEYYLRELEWKNNVEKALGGILHSEERYIE